MKCINNIKKYLCFIILIAFVSGCAAQSYPTYLSYTDENGYNTLLKIDGIVYKQAPGNWGIDSKQIEEKIGYLDDSSKPIYDIKGDDSRNYLYVKIDNGYLAYFKRGYDLPDISADTVNTIKWWDSSKTREITDKDIIKLFFKDMNNGINIKEHSKWEVYGQCYCYLKQNPGIYYTYQIISYNGMYACSSFPADNYIEISKEVVEQVSGH